MFGLLPVCKLAPGKQDGLVTQICSMVSFYLHFLCIFVNYNHFTYSQTNRP